MKTLLMSLNGMEIPLLDKFLPFMIGLTILSLGYVFISRMIKDQSINPKKVIGWVVSGILMLIFYFNTELLLNWLTQMLTKVIEMSKTF